MSANVERSSSGSGELFPAKADLLSLLDLAQHYRPVLLSCVRATQSVTVKLAGLSAIIRTCSCHDGLPYSNFAFTTWEDGPLLRSCWAVGHHSKL